MTTPDIYRDAEYITDVFATPSGASDDYDFGQEDRVKKTQSNAKVVFLDRLLRDLDVLIYCELSALYYMDCSIVLFLLRAIIQLIFFTPKASPFDPSRNHPFISGIFASNIFCMVVHKLSAQPEASEAMRGYVHGGLFIDFIGQKAPVSIVRLLSMDMLIMIIDFIMLGLVIERVKTVDASKGLATDERPSSSSGDDVQQDHDSEERGVLRRERIGEDGIELDELDTTHTQPHNTAAADDNDDNERTNLLADPSETRPDHHHHHHRHQTTTKPTHPLDAFVSGELLLMDIGLLNIIRDQWRYSPATALSAQSSSTGPLSSSTGRSRYVPSAETASFLRERFGLQISADGRVERIEQ